MKLLIATNNRGKVKEIERMLNLPGLELVTPVEAGLSADFDVEETGLTYAENAILKAVQYAQATSLMALADDSGLEVAALNGEPGIYSKRYAGPGVTDAGRIAFLLDKLKDVPDDELGAQFVAVVALAGPDGQIMETQEGICEGTLTRQPRGSLGFGYDPIFVVADAQGRTMAELPDLEKDAVSHRGRAIARIKPLIERYL